MLKKWLIDWSIEALKQFGAWVFSIFKRKKREEKRAESVEDLKDAKTDEEIDEALDNIIDPD